jgi:cytoskeletal protein RodZ
VGDFGDKFRTAREKKELSLDDVSNVTKIGARMLRAIEQEHFDDLPGGVFNKGFIRAYAKHLGLDAEEAVSDYLTTLRQAQIDAQEVWEPPAATRSDRPKPHTSDPKKVEPKPAAPKPAAPVQVEELPDLQMPRAEHIRPSRKDFFNQQGGGVPWKIFAAAALVLVLGIFLWIRHSNRTRVAAVPPDKPAAVASAEAASIAPPSAQASQPPRPATTMASVPATTVPAATVPAATVPTATKAAAEEPVKSTPNTGATPSPQPDSSNDVTVKNFGKSSPKTSPKSVPSLSLVIRATQNSWVSVMADGQLVTQETLIAPAHTSVRASQEINVRVGNAAGVSFLWNGKEIAAEGGEAEVKNYIFDSTGMRVPAANSAGPGVP